jgi:type VI protein secretion system component VasF
MPSRADEVDGASSPPSKGASARERALRFNRGVIALCIAALLAILFLPI